MELDSLQSSSEEKQVDRFDRAVLCFAVVTTVVVALPIYFFQRTSVPLWMDEIVTKLIVSVPLDRLLSTTLEGCEQQLFLSFLPYWIGSRFLPGSTDVALRLTSLFGWGLAFLALVRLATRAGPLAGGVATSLLALTSPTIAPLLLTARPYPFVVLAATLSLDALLGTRTSEERVWWRGVAFFTLVLTHPLGFIAAGLMIIAELGWRRREHAILQKLTPILFGFFGGLTLLAATIYQQMLHLPDGNWYPAMTFNQIFSGMLQGLFPLVILVPLAVVASARPLHVQVRQVLSRTWQRGKGAPLGLLGLPVALAALALVGIPSAIARYGAPAAAAAVFFGATLAANRASRVGIIAVIAPLLLLLQATRHQELTEDAFIRRAIERLRSETSQSIPTLFDAPHFLLPELDQTHPDGPLGLVDLTEFGAGRDFQSNLAWGVELLRNQARVFGKPTVFSPSDLLQFEQFIFVDRFSWSSEDLRRIFPAYTSDSKETGVWLMQRQPARVS